LGLFFGWAAVVCSENASQTRISMIRTAKVKFAAKKQWYFLFNFIKYLSHTFFYRDFTVIRIPITSMNSDALKPIGIFDSGIGGLTVAHQISKILPQEDLIYFGDTAHLPYGDKSTAAIQAYSVKICNLLLSQNVKAILIACNSASAAAYELVKEYVGSKALVFNVIDPVVEYVSEQLPGKKIGLIGTKQTIFSNIFKKKIEEKDKGIDLKSLATPLLAPMIEEGFFNNKISNEVIEEYLGNEMLQGIEALILGCTHYPLIVNQINNYYKKKVEIIDSSRIVALFVYESLKNANLLNVPHKTGNRFYVSDFTPSFENATQIFFKDKVSLEHYPLWE
jgi:glutamate racemase